MLPFQSLLNLSHVSCVPLNLNIAEEVEQPELLQTTPIMTLFTCMLLILLKNEYTLS